MSALRTQITCCNKCAKRHVGCHATCEDYKRQSQEHEEFKALTRAETKARVEITAYRKHNRKRRKPPKPKLD